MHPVILDTSQQSREANLRPPNPWVLGVRDHGRLFALTPDLHEFRGVRMRVLGRAVQQAHAVLVWGRLKHRCGQQAQGGGGHREGDATEGATSAKDPGGAVPGGGGAQERVAHQGGDEAAVQGDQLGDSGEVVVGW